MRAESTIRCNQSPRSGEQGARPFLSRFLTRDAGHLLLRNTVASSLAFVLGLALMWVMVDRLGSDAVMAAGISFLAANSIHYSLAQTCVFHRRIVLDELGERLGGEQHDGHGGEHRDHHHGKIIGHPDRREDRVDREDHVEQDDLDDR